MWLNIIDAYKAHKSKLIGISYRITGSLSESEDIVHETFIRWFDADHKTIESPYFWLVTVATRLSLDYLKRASVKRQLYIGEWLPEPFVEDYIGEWAMEPCCDDKLMPEYQYEMDESISMALVVLLDKLSPPERATFILHDLFHFDFDEVGEILGRTGMSCRKLASRARAKINPDRISHRPTYGEHVEVVSAFFAAVKNGDLADLVTLLKANVTFHSDGGGKAPAALTVLKGSAVVAGFVSEKMSLNCFDKPPRVMRVWFNGSPGFVIVANGNPISAFNFEVSDRKINKIHALRNPDKLLPFKKFLSKEGTEPIPVVNGDIPSSRSTSVLSPEKE